MRGAMVAATAAWMVAFAPAAGAQDLGPVEEGLREQSCKALQGGTAGLPDQVPAEGGAGIPPTWPEAPPGVVPERVALRTERESFNRRYEFATRGGRLYVRGRGDAQRRERRYEQGPAHRREYAP